MLQISRVPTISLSLVSMFLTVALPFAVYAHPQCQALFLGGEAPSDPLLEYSLTQRFSKLGKPVSVPKFKSPARMILSRFAGQENFHGSRAQAWISNGKTFVTAGTQTTHQANAAHWESILAEQQDFSLTKMVETDYLTPQQASMFRRLGTSLEPGQVNFLEIVHDASQEEIGKFFPDGAWSRTGSDVGSHYHKSFTETPIKTAALWTVAGQVWDPKTGKRNVELAWEKEEARKGQKLDRTKYKFVWEAGRAAQDVPGDIKPLYAASALLAYSELRAHGGRLEDAYVMFHSFDEVNTRLYLRMHPNSLYPPGWSNPNDSLFLVPLKECLEKFPPRMVSHHVSRLVEISKGKLSDLDAIDLMLATRLTRWNELDFKTPLWRQETPIILHDVSRVGGHRLGFSVGQLGLDKKTGQEIFDYLAGELTPLLHSTNYRGKYQHAADSLYTGFHYQDMNGVEISNLDPGPATKHSDYSKMVLIASFIYYFDRVAQNMSRYHKIPLDKAYNLAAEGMRNERLTFGVTTSFPEIEKQLKSLGPARVTEQHGTVIEGGGAPDPFLVKAEPYAYRDARMYTFTFDQLRELSLRHPDLYRHLEGSLHAGLWRTQYLLSQVDVF